MARADCPTCGGSGWKVVERTTKGARALAAGEAGRPGAAAGEPKMVWAVPCDCTMGDQTERVLARGRVPERYRHCDFDNFETDNDIEGAAREEQASWNRNLAQAKLIVQRFTAEFPAGSEHGLLLMGPCGVGKTHLAVAALKEIVLRGHSGLFYDYRELLKEIQDSYNAESQATEMSVLEPVLEAEILVLDDTGSSKPSPWALETVGHVLNTRYNESRITILTTNFLDAESRHSGNVEPGAGTVGPRGNIHYADTYSGSGTPSAARFPSGATLRASNEDTFADRVGRRIRSRLYEMCRTVEITAPDYRKEIRNISRSRA